MQDPALFEAIGGTRGCHKLSQAFYARVGSDPVLGRFFPGANLRCAIEAFAAFLVQFLGGPSEDWQFRWHVSLRESHHKFQLGPEHRDAWLRLMQEALEEVEIKATARRSLTKLFDVAAAYLVDTEPANRRLSVELGRRWNGQLSLEKAVAAVRAGHADRAIRLAAECDRAVLPGLLAAMIGKGDAAMLAYVHQRLTDDTALIQERYAGRTLLHAAAGAGSLSTVELLLKLGADPNAHDGGDHTPLYCTGNEAARAQSAEVVHALVRGGARVDARDGAMSATPLHMAARRGNAVVAQALLDCGANAGIRDRRGDTPEQRAINCKKPHVAALLRAHRRG